METHKHANADVKAKLPLFSELGLATALLIFLLVFIFSKEFHVVVRSREYVPDEVVVEEIERTVQQKTQPKPSRPSFVVAQEDEEVAEEEDIDFADDDNWDVPPPPPPPMGAAEEEIIDFFAIEEPPDLIGGTEALYKLVRYPEMAQRAGVEGLAQIEFIVGPDGTPRDFVIKGERPPGLGFGDAAIAALQQVRFKPGKQRDRFVAVRMSQVIRFQLN
jgi:periplasmic protein TonB